MPEPSPGRPSSSFRHRRRYFPLSRRLPAASLYAIAVARATPTLLPPPVSIFSLMFSIFFAFFAAVFVSFYFVFAASEDVIILRRC